MDDYYAAITKEALGKLSPASRAFLAANVVEKRKLAVDAILRQVHECRWASMEVKRQGNKVNIEWAMNSSAGNPDKYVVTGTVADIKLFPQYETYSHSIIHNGRGNGSVNLELEEGHSYYVEFTFMDADEYTTRQKEQRSGPTESLIHCILFQVAVPLSDERKELLRKAIKITTDPSEKARHELEKYLSLENTFHEMNNKAIEQIKALKLPQAEEDDRIERFKEKSEQLRDEMRI